MGGRQPSSNSDGEWNIVKRFRDLPEGSLREALESTVLELVTFVTQPSCLETQADGVPCFELDNDCAECVKVRQTLEEVSRAVLEARRAMSSGGGGQRLSEPS